MKERIIAIIRDVERFFTDLKEENIAKEEDLYPKGKFYAVSMILFSLVNRAIDLGEEIISTKNYGFPSTYREVFGLLEKNKVIDKALYSDLSYLVYFRNLASHEYHTFTSTDVYKAYKKIGAIKKFIVIAKKFL